MKLHEDREAFLYAVGLAGEMTGMRQSFLEKDYWVTKALENLSKSQYREKVVFKGGTSLSKCYGIIERFSEDVDLAVDRPHGIKTSNTKTTLKAVEKIVAGGLQSRPGPGDVKLGLKRTTTYAFPQIVGQAGGGPTSEYLRLEITAYSRLHPSQEMKVESYLGEALRENGRTDIAEEFVLHPFGVRVLGLARTFSEKVMALVKRSNDTNPIQSLQEKVRHVYDLQRMLAKRSEVMEFLQGEEFFELLDQVAEDDTVNHTSDLSWLDGEFGGCCLFGSPRRTWSKIEPAYISQFKALLFGELPTSDEILNCLDMIGTRLRQYDLRPIPAGKENVPG